AEGAEIQLHAADKQALGERVGDLEIAERNAFKDVCDHLDSIPFWRDVIAPRRKLEDNPYRGVAETLFAVILAENDIRRQDTPSRMGAFAGLRSLPCLRCKTCQAVVYEKTTDRFAKEIFAGKERRVRIRDYWAVEPIDVIQKVH